MLFSSLTFLYFFLPLTLLATFAVPAKCRNGVLLAASLLFFSWGAPKFVFVLVATCLFDWILSVLISCGGRVQRVALRLGVATNLSLLFFFKYANFAATQLNAVLSHFGFSGVQWTDVVLPIGISFFTFQKISYLVDVYRGTVTRAPSFGQYLLYVSLFPQLIAGPIVRYHDVAQQLRARTVSQEAFLSGMWRFAVGLARKMLIANPLALVADKAFADVSALSCPGAWLGLYAYSMQIFFDFAGYSDMAIGIGRMLGFKFFENFNAPYISKSVTEFWRRWHISLGGFMKEYLYIPLGGNRVSPIRCIFNNWLVFILSGFWHGASWNFVIWGAWHGFWMSVDKVWRRLGVTVDNKEHAPLRDALRIAATFLVVMLGWVFFRAETFRDGLDFLKSLSGFSGFSGLTASPSVAGWLAFLVATFFAVAPAFIPKLALMNWEVDDADPAAVRSLCLRTVCTAFLLFASTIPLLTGGFNPFIYFKF